MSRTKRKGRGRVRPLLREAAARGKVLDQRADKDKGKDNDKDKGTDNDKGKDKDRNKQIQIQMR